MTVQSAATDSPKAPPLDAIHPLEQGQPGDAPSLFTQLSYNDFKTLLNPSKVTGLPPSGDLSFDTTALYNNNALRATGSESTDTTPSNSAAAKDSSVSAKDVTAPAKESSAPAKDVTAPTKDVIAPIKDVPPVPTSQSAGEKPLNSAPKDSAASIKGLSTLTSWTSGVSGDVPAPKVPTANNDAVLKNTSSQSKSIDTLQSSSQNSSLTGKIAEAPSVNSSSQELSLPTTALTDSAKTGPRTLSHQNAESAASPSSESASSKNATTGPVEPNTQLAALNNKVTTDVNDLSKDAKTLETFSKETAAEKAKDQQYQGALKNLNTDENSLHTDEKAFRTASESQSNFADFSSTMETHHAALKDVANQLDKMGMQPEASKTTSNFPLSHYEHEFDNTGTKTGTGPGNPKGAQTFSDMEAGTWKDNTKDKGKDSIGGSGDNPAIQQSYKDGVLTYDSTGGPGADTLISNKQDYKQGDNTFTLNYSMNRSAATAGNEQASEHDMVITGDNGYQAQAASQFNYNEKAPAGMCWFQTNNMATGKWTNAALVPIPTPGEYTNVSMTVKLTGDNQYSYTGLTINGKSYALDPSASTFSMEKENWTPNSVITQFQEDLNSKGGSISQEYKDVSVVASNT